jgi:dimethylamine corrinoid protein
MYYERREVMDERYQLIADSLGELDEDAFNAAVQNVVDSNPSEEEADEVIKSFSVGMDKVGDYFEEGEYFVGDLIYAADILYNGIDAVKPFISSDGSNKIGSMVLGSAPGDLHDIGKNIFKSMAEAGGFEVYDLGVDVQPEVFVEKVKEVKPNIVGISGLLTLSLDSMGDVINALKEAGVRDDLKVMIGGNPVSEAVMLRVGADAWSTNASTGVKQLKEWMV